MRLYAPLFSLCTALAASLLPLKATAQQEAHQVRLTTAGACSPAIVNNAGSIVINCGPDSEELARALNSILGSRSKDEILETLQKLQKELAGLKKETSSDPRKELANIGGHWTGEEFGAALVRGDTRTVKLFLAGKDKMLLYSAYQGEYALAKFISAGRQLNNFNELFRLLLAHGLNVDFELSSPLSPFKTLAEHAVAAENLEAFKLIWRASERHDAIREMVKQRVAEEQAEQSRAHAQRVRADERNAEVLLRMLLIAEPDNVFSIKGHEVLYDTGVSGRASPKSHLYDGPDGWFLVLDTTSLVQSLTYEVRGQRHVLQKSTRLPIELSELDSALTPVQIEAVDALGRSLRPITITIDREDLH